MDPLCYLCLVVFMLSRMFIAALQSPAGKELISWLFFVIFNCVIVTFPCGILGQVWYLIVLIHILCHFSYFVVTFIVCVCVCGGGCHLFCFCSAVIVL